MRSARESTASATGKAIPSNSPGAYQADDLGLSFYNDAPNVEVSIREFEEYTRDRLKVLHTIERMCGFNMPLHAVGELRPRVAKELADSRLTLAYPMHSTASGFLDQKVEFIRRDSISHFALRLAFCKSRESREWFLRQEQRMFVMRFETLSTDAKEAFFVASGVRCKKFEGTATQLEELQLATPAAKIWKEGAIGRPDYDKVFYEMPFFEVSPNLISTRRVVVRGGVAYVPSSALKLILAKLFKDRLTATLDVAFQGLPTALADPRVGGFLRDLQQYGMQLLVAPKSNTDDPCDQLTLENFEAYSARSFPPCMRRLVEKQRETKKRLKHAGKLQLRPFLKDCGFTFESSLAWWKQELCRDAEVDASSFEKDHTYDIEHAYGKKGHLQGQHCFGCPKIIGFPEEAAGQVHGCPFKHMETPALNQLLHRWRVPEETMYEIEKLIVNGKHYQLGCIEYFKAQHPGHTGDGVGNSPTDFFKESLNHYVKKEKENEKQKDGKQQLALAA
jgi:DNA primase large subunit